MIEKKNYAAIEKQLRDLLAGRFEDVRVQIGDSVFYPGTNVVVTSSAFAGLLAEQRFHHVVREIPAELYEKHLRGGVVWFELAPGESGADYMAMPRSDDIASEESAILEQLGTSGFFEKLRKRFEPDPRQASVHDFTVTRELLFEAGLSDRGVTRACLFFIRHGGFCDLQVLVDVLPRIAKEHAA